MASRPASRPAWYGNMAIIIRPDGSTQDIQPHDGHSFQLNELKPIVGEGTARGTGYIEIIPCKDKRFILVINEEGKNEGLPINAKASELASLPTQADIDRLKALLGEQLIVVGDSDPLHGPDVIVGTVLLCMSSEVE